MFSAIVILNYNDGELTRNYVKKISKYKVLDYIIIVDNCSSDDSITLLEELTYKDSRIKLLQSKENKGYAAGNNIGLKFIVDKFGPDGVVFISNPDIEVEESVFQNLKYELENSQQLFAASGLVHNLNGKAIPICMWKLPTLGMLFVNSSIVIRNLMHRCFSYGTKYKLSPDIISKKSIVCEAIPGCFFACKIDEMNTLGFFDEETFLFYEEDILFSKARDAGYYVALFPQNKIVHMEGVSVKKSLNSWKKREFILEDSAIVYIRKCLRKSQIATFLYRCWNRFFLMERYLFYKFYHS